MPQAVDITIEKRVKLMFLCHFMFVFLIFMYILIVYSIISGYGPRDVSDSVFQLTMIGSMFIPWAMMFKAEMGLSNLEDWICA